MQVFFRVKIDSEEISRLENNDPRSFENVQIYAGDYFNEPANALYQNLQYENIEMIEKGRLIDTVSSWGPLFRISFDLFITSFGPSVWSSILSFKGNGGTNNCCNNGDRIPIVQLHDNGELYFINSINGNGNAYFHTAVDTGKWYEIEIEQNKIDGEVENKHIKY